MKAKIYKYDYSNWPYAKWYETLTGEPKFNDDHKCVDKALVQECNMDVSGNRYTVNAKDLPIGELLYIEVDPMAYKNDVHILVP